jgi:hypothetical protein
MEFHGKFDGIEFHGILLNFMKLRLMEFHGKFHGIPWNSMEFRQLTEFDGIRF